MGGRAYKVVPRTLVIELPVNKTGRKGKSLSNIAYNYEAGGADLLARY